MRITADDDANQERTDRLWSMMATLDDNSRRRIGDLHDSKGLIFVNWITTPSTEDIVALSKAWAAKGECQANHYVFRELILADCEAPSPFKT